MNGTIICTGVDGSYIKITNSDLCFVDRYGNETNLKDIRFTYKQNSPSYDELYNYWLKTKHNSKGETTMKDKFTMELVWHNCVTCPPKEDFNANLCLTNGRTAFGARYDRGEWYDREFDVCIPDYMLENFWWADIVQTISGLDAFKTGDKQ